MKVLILLAVAAMAVASPQYVEESNVAAQKALHHAANPYAVYDDLGRAFAVPVVAAAPAPVFAPAHVPLVASRIASVPAAPLIANTADGTVAYPTYNNIAY